MHAVTTAYSESPATHEFVASVPFHLLLTAPQTQGLYENAGMLPVNDVRS